MAVTVKNKDPWKVLKAFGISASNINSLKLSGVGIVVSTSTIKFVDDGDVLASVPVKAGAVSMAVAGDLGPASIQAIGYKLAKAIQTVLKSTSSALNNPPDTFDEPPKKKNPSGVEIPPGTGKMKHAGTETGTFSANASEQAAAADVMNKMDLGALPADVSNVLAKAPVKLSKATTMYQPVKASSSGSVYHVVGMTPDLKMAARFKGETLSVRVEGEIIKHKEKLTIGAFSMSHFDQGYASVHLNVGNIVMARRAIAAILSDIVEDLVTPMPNMLVLAEQGK